MCVSFSSINSKKFASCKLSSSCFVVCKRGAPSPFPPAVQLSNHSHCQAVTISVLSTIRLNVGQSMTTLMDSSADADAFCSAWWLVMGTSNRRVRCSPGSSSLPLSQFLFFCSALFPLLSFTVSVILPCYYANWPPATAAADEQDV